MEVLLLSRPLKDPDEREFTLAAEMVGASAAEAASAFANVKSGSVQLLALNGKLASGKDTVAPAVLSRLGAANPQHLSYATWLKNEIDLVVAAITVSDSPQSAAAQVAQSMGVESADAGFVTGVLWQATRRSGHGLTARSRTPEMRLVLQYWGTEVRRKQDDNYWVKRALRDAVASIAHGNSVYFTDVRFPNEVEWAQRLGFPVIRLEVDHETQRQRHVHRDGSEPDAQALRHPSETSLDGYEGFDAVIDNSGALAETVEAICQLLEQRQHS